MRGHRYPHERRVQERGNISVALKFVGLDPMSQTELNCPHHLLLAQPVNPLTSRNNLDDRLHRHQAKHSSFQHWQHPVIE